MPRRFLYPRAASAVFFPSVPHLAGSAAGPGDVVFTPAQTRAFLSGPVRVVEKLDGLNVGLFFTPRGALRFVSRARGVLRPAQLGPGLWPLVDWAFGNVHRLLPLLGARRVLYGEWLAGPRRLPYPGRRTDFVAFALFERGAGFLPSAQVDRRVRAAGLTPPPVRFEGRAPAAEALARWCRTSVFGGPAEGVVVETRDGRWAKWVRADWEARPVAAPVPQRGARPGPPPTRGRFVKRFSARRADDAAVEAAVLRAVRGLRLAPTPREVRRDADGAVTLVLDALGGRAWPRLASPALAAALGRQLGRLHGAPAPRKVPRLGAPSAGDDATGRPRLARPQARTSALDRSPPPPHLGRPTGASLVRLARLPGGPAAHARAAARALAQPTADAHARLAAFLKANAEGLAPAPSTLCHGDLKPENLRVTQAGVWLLDVERALLADPAWELACAMDRLGLDAAGRQALLEGWSAERADAEVAVRAQLFRLAWQVALPAAVASLRQDTGRGPSARARRLARAARRRGARLLDALSGLRPDP